MGYSRVPPNVQGVAITECGSVICGRQYRRRIDVRVLHDGRLNELDEDKLEPEEAFPMNLVQVTAV